MTLNKEDLKNKIIYRASYRGTKEMDILMTAFVKSLINDLDENFLKTLDTFVDMDDERLDKLSSKSDLRVIEGNASHPNILMSAGAENADMLIAVTSSDEVNMVSCQIASTLFNTQTKIARIRQAEYTKHSDLFSEGNIPVDFILS